MMMACIALFLACGTIGFYACFWFTMKIYGSLKVDCHFCFTHVVLLPDFAGVASYSQGYSAGGILNTLLTEELHNYCKNIFGH